MAGEDRPATKCDIDDLRKLIEKSLDKINEEAKLNAAQQVQIDNNKDQIDEVKASFTSYRRTVWGVFVMVFGLLLKTLVDFFNIGG